MPITVHTMPVRMAPYGIHLLRPWLGIGSSWSFLVTSSPFLYGLAMHSMVRNRARALLAHYNIWQAGEQKRLLQAGDLACVSICAIIPLCPWDWE